MEKQIVLYMKKLGISKEEAIELYNEDKAIDKMTSTKQIDSDLNAEQKKAIKKAKATGERKAPTTYKFAKKERPKDEEKVNFMNMIFEFIKDKTTNCVHAKLGSEITFTLGENEYSLKLVKHRKK